VPERLIEERRELSHELRPELRGFRAPILLDDKTLSADDPWYVLMPGADASHPLRQSAELVARGLARDGLIVTLAKALAAWHAPQAEKYLVAFDNSKMDWLRSAGLPVDLLPFFSIDENEHVSAESIVARIENRLASGAAPESLRSEHPFHFRATAPGFRVSTESGEQDIGLVRLQLTSGTYWAGAGDGGSLDLVRQLVEALPDAKFFASIEEKHLARFLETARDWKIARDNRFTLSPETLPVAQWAQDDAKPGWIEPSEIRGGEIATLVPRYASRGEDGATFVPGETFLMEGFVATGRRVVQSPLLFQGGNLIAARHPSSGERILFLGEAEIHRNTALGLTREQVLEAFRIELGVDRCVVLPAVSFHIDCELCLRAVGKEFVAFVNDTPAAARIVFECGLACLEKSAAIDAPSARAARTSLAAGRIGEAVDAASGALVPHMRGPGRFAESFAQSFSTASWDSGVGNLETFLLALDLLQSETVRPRATSIDANTAAYLESLHRREVDRSSLVKILAQTGCTIVRVPSFSDGDRGLNYVNGVHTRGSYLMPAHGGLFAPLDRAAQFAFEAALGSNVKVLPLHTSESQRRSGAIHCSISVYPSR
jgi:hypothetical protein